MKNFCLNSKSKKISAFFLSSFLLLGFFLFGFSRTIFATAEYGAIDSSYKYAWGENIGWVNFGCQHCGVMITDGNVTGYAWSKQYGWIYLSPSKGGVRNNTTGTLSGYAWGESVGWINFSGVSIDGRTGEFSGYATIRADSSRINFNCSQVGTCASYNFKVKTDWRMPSERRNDGPVFLPGSGSSSVPSPTPPPVAPKIPPTIPTTIAVAEVAVQKLTDVFSDTIGYFSEVLSKYLLGKKNLKNIAVQIPKETPLSFGSKWNLLPESEIRAFVFAPLPYEVRMLASKFPELGETFREVGVNRMTNMEKLVGVDLKIPGLSSQEGKMLAKLGSGKIALVKGLPLADFSLAEKRRIPSEFVFARASSELLDLNVAMSVSDTGEVAQKISSISNERLKLVVKPIAPARKVTGYFIFKSAAPKVMGSGIPRSSLFASAVFSLDGLVEKAEAIPLPEDTKMVLSSFEYTDPDKDGIYTADVLAPAVPGEYEIITIIDYIDPVLGARQIKMVAVIDPEGYVYEKNNGKETRIPNAVISLYHLNPGAKEYELWPARDYQQENPQVTDLRGTYSFLVPEGIYYFIVEAPGYKSY
jgi:hypothetical protein